MEIKQRLRMMLALCAVFALAVGVATAAAGNGGTSQKKLCYQGGWQTVYGTDGTTFTSQKSCVSYVAGGGTLTTTPPPVRFGSLIDCENVGGTYTTTDPVWKCLNASFPDWDHLNAATATLEADCWAEGGTGGFYSYPSPGADGSLAGTDFYCSAL